MKIKSILLRWYKSFNISYTRYSDRRTGAENRPWNKLHSEQYSDQIFPFVEIPIESDITTIVGANESGKSHLLSAVHKVLTGVGAPSPKCFSRTDLCLYAAPRSQNTDLWPYIGLEFEAAGDEITLLNEHLRLEGERDTVCFSLILGPQSEKAAGYLFVESKQRDLSEGELGDLRRKLPSVQFIVSDVSISGSLELLDLLAAYEHDVYDTSKRNFPSKVTQEVARSIMSLPQLVPNQNVSPNIISQLESLKNQLQESLETQEQRIQLELLLFRDLLGVERETLDYLSRLGESDRSYIECLVTAWNREIDARLNLSRYWQQDEAFNLQVNCKKSVIYFEITDKTGATYTFRDRSSGLRYFLSYYIQAKALQSSGGTKGSIILMDEPDSFLSISGQRNLLSVFESLVSADLVESDCQLIYTTHSPFLINRNFPRRVRLVRKGDAEEGSQFIEESRVRRYEPIRSALGIDCAQTLFMGSTNLVLEGPTDQYLLSELIRLFITRQNASEFIDLNSLVLTSADSASAIEKLLAASQWGDEPNPTVVVLLDNDQAGQDAWKRITGKARKAKRLISENFVLTIGDTVGAYEKKHKVVTIEDILPRVLYQEAVLAYVSKWYPEIEETKKDELAKAIGGSDFATDGLVAGAGRFFVKHIFEAERGFDKLGVLQEAVTILRKRLGNGSNDEVLGDLYERVKGLCSALREKVEEAEREEVKRSGKQAVVRIISDFMKVHRNGSDVFEIQTVLRRIAREADYLGVDSDRLKAALGQLLGRIDEMRTAGHERLQEESWTYWSRILGVIREDPLDPRVDEIHLPARDEEQDDDEEDIPESEAVDLDEDQE